MIETADVVLITAIDEEFETAKTVFSAASAGEDGVRDWTERETISSAPHLTGHFFLNGIACFRVALAKPTRMGANRIGHLATVLVERLKPKYLVMCGVCAGNPGDLALGDVVVSELTYQYDEGKREADGFVGDHRQSPISQRWLKAADSLRAEQLPSYGRPTLRDARYWLLERLHGGANPRNHPARGRYFNTGEWQATIEKLEKEGLVSIDGMMLRLTDAGKAEVERSILLDVDPPEKLPFAIKIGPIASGNVVVKDGLTWDMLKRMGVRSVLGLEMEAAAIGEIARMSGVEEWIVIKGVMDHADPKKDDRFRPFAARASAEVLRAFLIDRFVELTSSPHSQPSAGQVQVVPPLTGWRPRTVDGPFFDELHAAIEQNAPRFKGLFELAVAKAKEAHEIADQAYEISERVRVVLGDAIGKSHRGRLGKRPKILKVETDLKTGERPLIAKIWNSHDEYVGEAAGAEADGLGVVRIYLIAEDITPSLRSSYSGLHETGRFGPLGVYTFPDQSQFAGQWEAQHPYLGYREFIGDLYKLQCDFYLGYMSIFHERFWRPHGEGVAVDAGRRHVRCGVLEDGNFRHVSFEFNF
jgi:nucleoside phosphorylase